MMITTCSSSRRAEALEERDCPPAGIATPCFVVLEDALLHNLQVTAGHCGGIARLMPHIKTHRAGWVVSRLVEAGVRAFKAATVAEARMALQAGASRVLWAYPTVNSQHLDSFLGLASQHPQASLGALIDSSQGLEAWRSAAAFRPWPANLHLHVDLDPGLSRTGAPIGAGALELALAAHTLGAFGGWHVYDGHIHGRDIELRRSQVSALVDLLRPLVAEGKDAGLGVEVIAGTSYSFDLWPGDLATYVAPGSWAYSSAQHDVELPHLQWKPAAFVLATVISRHGSRITLDAGAKAISPDKPMPDRFRWDSPILMMNEEHVVVDAGDLDVGDRVMLLPRHACTTAYLYDKALVRREDGNWEVREQLGGAR